MRKLPLLSYYCLFSFVLCSTVAQAEVSLLAPTLKVAVGGSMKLFTKQQKTSIQDELDKKLERATDPVLRNSLKRLYAARIANLEHSLTQFDGPSAYDSSILAGEFQSGVGDSMVQQQSGDGKIVYFFNANRLWKAFQELPPTADKAALTEALSQQFGTPTQRETPKGIETQVWIVEGRELILADRIAEYGCLTFSVADASLAEARRIAGTPARGKRALNPLLSSVLSEETDDSISNVVDNLLGGQTAATR